jgi:hypothetical protein
VGPVAVRDLALALRSERPVRHRLRRRGPGGGLLRLLRRGKSFVKLGSLVNALGLVPSEAELNFLGKDGTIAVSLGAPRRPGPARGRPDRGLREAWLLVRLLR